MSLNIKNEEADRLARELADLTGETLTAALTIALRERLEREAGRKRSRTLRHDITRIQQRVARLPRLDDRSDDVILGYDEHGLPG